MLKKFWDDKYSEPHYVYGEEPNQFFRRIIDNLPQGKILLPADGEGRNGVYAAIKGWQVEAFDVSSEAKNKALLLAQVADASISYKVLDIKEAITHYPPNYFDVIALIYLHVSLQFQIQYYKELMTLLKPNGYIIFEGFSKAHRRNQLTDPLVGGPQHLDLLYSKEELEFIFNSLRFIEFSEDEVVLSEGIGHNGRGSVVRFVGQKTEKGNK